MTSRVESVRAQYRDVFRFVRRRVPSRETAEDITQEVFASAAAQLARSADGAAPTVGWLYTVARRRLIDEGRRRGLSTVPLDAVPDPAAAENEYGTAVAEIFCQALLRLPEQQRRVLLARLIEDRSFKEIAREVGASEEACRMRFMRALAHIRTEFEREGLDP
jgi:RNA polymerase sigma factor (sigma-70 family)